MVRSRSQALCSLLDDDDPCVVATITDHLRHDEALLDAVWQETDGAKPPHPVLRELILEHDGTRLVHRFAAADDLESGMGILAELHRPRVDHARRCRRQLNALTAALPMEIGPADIARELCSTGGFTGDQDDFHHPRNSYLPCILERRRGLPISLTAIWLFCCRRRGLEAEAIALPGHVVGRTAGVFIDCFAGGRVIALSEIVQRCGSLQQDHLEALLEPTPDRVLLARMARNLITSYHLRRDEQRMYLARRMSHQALATAAVSR